ncbi:rootletin-like isoform X1 [Bacillus rossius redtenbacheri]|uniref:rootletin-like isoform X1 n=1 Tax=Bacillus rossius redtenbacheri TaxID=93214 RepID=UPI002FDE68C3
MICYLMANSERYWVDNSLSVVRKGKGDEKGRADAPPEGDVPGPSGDAVRRDVTPVESHTTRSTESGTQTQELCSGIKLRPLEREILKRFLKVKNQTLKTSQRQHKTDELQRRLQRRQQEASARRTEAVRREGEVELQRFAVQLQVRDLKGQGAGQVQQQQQQLQQLLREDKALAKQLLTLERGKEEAEEAEKELACGCRAVERTRLELEAERQALDLQKRTLQRALGTVRRTHEASSATACDLKEALEDLRAHLAENPVRARKLRQEVEKVLAVVYAEISRENALEKILHPPGGMTST